MVQIALHTLGVLLIAACLTVFSYLDRIYRELGRVTTGRVHAHLEIFEAEIEPRLHLPRRRAALGFSLLTRLWLVLMAVETARGVVYFVPERVNAFAEMVVFLVAEVLLAMHFLPDLLVARTTGRWLRPLTAVLRGLLWFIWPLRIMVEMAGSLARISDEDETLEQGTRRTEQEGIEALVEAAQQEGILEDDQAEMIEQVVEFGDKRVSEVMTPRPDMVAISGDASLEDLRLLVVEKKFSRIPVYSESLDDILGIAYARDLLEIPDNEARQRKVRELIRPALFVPESKHGSELLKELQRLNQQMAIAVDEHGLVAGLVTAEDLVEEIIGEIGEEDRPLAPDMLRESDGSLILRGSFSVERLQDLFGMEFSSDAVESATTVAGLLNHLAGHVPKPGEKIDFNGLTFSVIEANQRKVLRLRAERHATALSSPEN
ncbi:MAG TPA: hemolysin family protein [Candidatus Acidoferrales bacterium]|nr:hemolysin family protein [Candidatus Acidoferrales bacterium]